MADIKIEKRSISFNDAKSKFSNDRLQTDSSSNESIDTIDKEFKYEVKFPSVIHTTTRKNNVGDGLNELSARKKQENPFKTQTDMPLKAVDNMLFGGINDSTPCITPQRSEVSSVTEGELETIKFLKTLSKQERETLGFSSKQQDNQKVETSKKTYNPLDWNPIYQGKKRFSPDRLNVHPLLRNNADMYGNITSGTKPYSAPGRCMVTHDGSELETKMERKHEFRSDLSIKHAKVDTTVCSITKGNDKKGVRPDASHAQKPLSGISGVKVDNIGIRVKRLIDQFENGFGR